MRKLPSPLAPERGPRRMGPLCPPGPHSAPATATSPSMAGAARCSSAAPRKCLPLAGPQTGLPAPSTALCRAGDGRPTGIAGWGHRPRHSRARCLKLGAHGFAGPSKGLSRSREGRTRRPACLFKPSWKPRLRLPAPSSAAGSHGEPQLRGAAVLTAHGGEGGRAGIVPEELEAHSLPVSRSLSPSLVSATAEEAGAFEQEAPTMWCLRRRRPEHLDLGLCSAANSLAPSCNQSRRQGGWQMTREHRTASPQTPGQALPPPREGGRPSSQSLQQVLRPCRLCFPLHRCLVGRGSLASPLWSPCPDNEFLPCPSPSPAAPPHTPCCSSRPAPTPPSTLSPHPQLRPRPHSEDTFLKRPFKNISSLLPTR